MDGRPAQPHGEGPRPSELAPGTVLAGMRIEGVAGRGGMGVVYRATDMELGRPVALKLIADDLAGDPAFRERFIRETRVAAAIDHPNVIPVFSAGEDDGRLFIAMRLVEGADVRTLVRAEGRLDPERAARIVAQVGAALDAAHARGIVHRDVKPANVLLGPGDHAYLTDFGLAKRVDAASQQTRAGGWVGTLGYVAPEQIRGAAVDARTDVYALGCVLFNALTGVSPFARDSDEATLWAHLNDAPPDAAAVVPGVPAASAAVVARALAKDPADRFPSAGDLGRAALGAVGREEPRRPERTVATGDAAPSDEATRTSPTPAGAGAGAPTAATRPDEEPTRRGRRPVLVVGATALVLALGLGGAVLAGAGGGDGEDDGTAARPTTPEAATTARAPATPPQGRVAGRFAAGRPNDLAAADGAVYAASFVDERVARVRAAGLQRRPGLETGTGVQAVAACGGSLWVAKARTGSMLRFALRTGARRGRVPLPSGLPVRIACSRGSVFVALRAGSRSREGDRIVRFSTRGALERTYLVDGIQDMAVGAGAIWVTSRTRRLLTRVAVTTDLRRQLQSGAGPSAVVVDGGHVWVANTGDGTVARFTTRGRIRRDQVLDAGDEPSGLAAGDGTLLVSDYLGNAVLRFTEGGRRLGALRGITNPRRVVIDGDVAWVASPEGGFVTRVRL